VGVGGPGDGGGWHFSFARLSSQFGWSFLISFATHARQTAAGSVCQPGQYLFSFFSQPWPVLEADPIVMFTSAAQVAEPATATVAWHGAYGRG
jgi:hypothetical protein